MNDEAGQTIQRLQTLELYAFLGFVVAVVVTLVAGAVLHRQMSRQKPQRIVQLHSNQTALASMEFLLVLIPLMAIVFAVWQLGMMLNAQMQVGYAAYAAGRSASVIAFMELPEEPAGELKNNGEKWARINRAAIPGVIAISPGDAASATAAYLSTKAEEGIVTQGLPDIPTPSIDEVTGLPAILSLLTLHRGLDNMMYGSRLGRGAVKTIYAQRATRVLIEGRDQTGDKNGSNFSGNLQVPEDSLFTVTVEYDFWLNVPLAARLMKAAFGGSSLAAGVVPRYEPTIKLSETVVVRGWPKLKAF